MESSSNSENSPDGQCALSSHNIYNYGFSQENLDDIPHPDDSSCKQQKPITMLLHPDDLELPPFLPEQTSSKSLPEPKVPEPCNPDEFLFPAQIPLPDDHFQKFTVPALRSDTNADQYVFLDIKKKSEEEPANTEMKTPGDSARYSPSKMDSDEENQDFITIKPKVLGKEQAKKRLMAFSLSKQPTCTVKKQNKIASLPKNIKEKPPNPNKSTGVQDQFRATISEIEEEKKRMMQNMPNYLLLEMSDLAKATHPIITSSLKLLEKHKAADAEMKDAGKKEDENLNKSDESRSQEYKESGNKSKQRSKSPNRSYERTRSRSRERKYNKKRRDSSKSGRRRRSRSRSPVKKSKDKCIKQDKKDSDNYPKKKDLHEDWKSFKASGFTGISDIWNTILQREESEKERDKEYRWSPSPSNDRRCFKPIFNYLKQDQRFIKSFQARSVDSRSSNLVVFTEKNIKYTKTKPMLIWSENPSVATEFYMSRQMLLDNCDSDAVGVLNFILHSEVNSHHDFNTSVKSKIREWYSDINQFLRPPMASLYDEFQVDVPKGYEKSEHKANKTMQSFLSNDNDKVEHGNKIDGKKDTAFINEDRNGNEKNEKWDTKKGLKERRINLVNDTYKSDEEKATGKLKEMVMGDVKVQMNLDMNCVKVRSRWDSDYECEQSDNEEGRQKDNISGSEPEIKLGFADRNVNLSSDISKNDYQEIKPAQQVERREPDTQCSKNEAVVSNIPCSDKAGNLASEYEEFLKMVSFEFDSGQPVENKDKSYGSGSKIEKTKSSNNKTETGKQMFELTDWDKDSDHEGKTNNKTNSRKSGSEKEFLLENEKVGPKQKKSKKTVLSKKKALKLKTEKLTKRAAKEKKKRQGSSSSTESSSDSYDSDSDSISDWDDSTLLKKKKKKVRKTKKKYKKQSSSSSSDSESDSSDSDSDDSKSKKRKGKKKREKKKKKDGSNKSEDERESILLKELDIKKQIIMKKIEEIDSISERNGKKKNKERKSKKREKENIESAESPGKYSKSRKKKKTDVKGEKNKKGKSSSKAEKENKGTRKKNFSSDSSEENSNKVKSKKKVKKVESKKDRDITKSSDSDLDKEEEKDNRSAGTKRSKSHEKTVKKVKKNKKLKKKSYSSSNTDSDSSPDGENDKPKKKKVRSKEDDENTNCGWKDDFMMDDDFRKEKNRSSLSGGKSEWKESKKKSNEKVKKNLKDNGDWEASSSEESLSDSKSRESWEEAPCNDKKITKTEVLKEKFDKNIDFKNSEKSSSDRKPPNESDKDNSLNSFSNFSFGFESELSRDFLLTTHGYSNSEPLMGNQDYGNMDIERRLSSSVSQSNDQTKPTKSELYSPGHSDSDVSENERVENTEKTKSSSRLTTRDEKYDPLNSESESSLENDEDINTIPLPRVSSTSLPSETKMSDMKTLITPEISSPTNVDNSHGIGFSLNVPANGSPKFKMKSINFTPSQLPSSVTNSFVEEADKIAVKKQLMSVKSQPKLKSKAAAVFQEDSDESNSDVTEKPKEISPAPVTDVQKTDRMPEETSYKSKSKEHDSEKKKSTKTKSDEKKPRKRERSKERTDDKDRKKRSSSRERRSSSKSTRAKVSSPLRRRKSRSPEFIPQTPKKESKREILSDSFEIEPLKSAAEYQDLEETIQPIPVLTGLGVASSEQTTWTRSHFPGYTSNELTSGSGQLIDPSESFDIYPSEDSAYSQKNTDKVSSGRLEDSVEKTKEKKEIRRSRSRSMSPRKRRRSKSPEKRKKSRSPRRKSKSPKRRGRSPYSPRRKSPKRKSPSRRYRSSRSPDRRRKSRSRSPRKRRASPGRRSHSASPRGHRCDSPRRRSSPSRGYSPRGSLSPRRDSHFSSHFSSSFHNRIPVIGGGSENLDPELSPSSAIANPMGFSHQPPGFNDSDMNNSYYNPDYTGEFGTTNYPEEIGVNNLITLKNPDVDKTNSPERLSLDQRIELELGVPMNNQGPGDQYQKGQFQEVNFQSSYNCEDGNAGQEPFYPTHNVPMNSEYNSSYYNGQPPPQPGYGSFQQYPNSQGSMLQVGNNVEVVPSMQHSHSSPAVPAKNSCHQIMQVGNVLQVVPSQKSSQGSPMPFHGQNYGPPGTSPVPSVKTQKATAVVAPSSIVPQQNPEAMINPLIKAIQLEREKRKLEKKKRKEEREARRKARQLRREAKLMSVNEKLKKSVQDEGLMLGQEVEDDELLDGLDLPSPPIPVEIITVSSPSALPPAGKGILITAGFMPKPPSEKKEVKFADGVLPGEGTSSSGEEDIASPPPKPKLPKEKRYKKKKMKVKKKVKVQIIKEIIQDEDEDDDLSPPPPPPGSPPPIYFARFPFAGDAQFPVYQMQTTTTTLTTVQYATPTF